MHLCICPGYWCEAGLIQPARRAAHGVVGRNNALGRDVDGIVGSSRSIEGHGWVLDSATEAQMELLRVSTHFPLHFVSFMGTNKS